MDTEVGGFFPGAEAEVVVQWVIVSVGFVLSFAALLLSAMEPSQLDSRIPRRIVDSESTLVDVTAFSTTCLRISTSPCGSATHAVTLIIRIRKTACQRGNTERVSCALHRILGQGMLRLDGSLVCSLRALALA